MRSLSTVREKAELDKAIKEVFLATNKALHASPIDTMLSGSTCCALLLLGKQLVTANVGDSRCIAAHFQMRAGRLTLVARALTTDHKPDSPTEKARIISRGGRVEPWAGAGLDDIQRVWLRDEETPGIGRRTRATPRRDHARARARARVRRSAVATGARADREHSHTRDHLDPLDAALQPCLAHLATTSPQRLVSSLSQRCNSLS